MIHAMTAMTAKPVAADAHSDADKSVAQQQVYRALGELIAAVGSAHFGATLFALARAGLGADHAVANLVGRQQIHGLFTEGLVPARIARTLNQRYLERYHLLDKSLPLSWDVGRGSPVAVPFDSQLNGSPTYSAFFFERVGLCDRISLISTRDDSMVVCNLYRLSDSGKFSAHDLRQAQALALPLTAALWLHAQQCSAGGMLPVHLQAHAGDGMREQLLNLLSRREMEVCRRLLAGASNEGVALDLALSTHTVRTLRKRIYKKLQVSSLTDLFSQYLQVVAARNGDAGDALAVAGH
jgi:DNA-binding CsgD family transcriptional regulator